MNTWFELAQVGAVTGLAIAMPMGAVGTMLVMHTTTTGPRASAAAALGVATADGLYALVAALGGVALKRQLGSVMPALNVLATIVLFLVVALLLMRALREAPDAAD